VAPVYANTGATGWQRGIDYPLYQNVARVQPGVPGDVNASLLEAADGSSLTLNTSVDGSPASVTFDASSVTSNNGEVMTAEKQQNGLNYTMLLAGLSSLDYSRYGVWMQENGDQILQGNELLASAYGGMETPVANIPTSGSFTYSGQTLGVGVDSTGNVAAIAGDIGLTADFATRSVSGIINNMVLSNGASTTHPGTTAQLSGGIAANGFSGNMSVKDAGAATIGAGTFDGRFFGPSAEEVAGKWAYDGNDGSKAIGAFGAKR
jgi:hypothetical protein